MSLTKTVGLVAGTTLAIGGAAFGVDQNSDLAAEVANLKAQIAEMKNAQGDAWLTEQRAAEIRGIVTDVLADADTRSSLQGSGAGAGYNGGFFMSSSDGNYSMKVNVLEQIRWTFNDRSGTGTNNQSWGFENKRTRLSFGGNMVDSTWSYKVSYYFAYSNDVEFNGESPVLADAMVAKDLGNGLSLTVGQFKLPFSGEYGVDAGNLQFNDYSTVSNAFSNNYGQGLMISYKADMFRAAAAYVNSLDQVNANWGTGATPSDEFAFTGRVEAKLAGNWDQFNDAMSFKGEEMGVLIGGGVNWSDSNTAGVGDIFGVTVDATVDFGGASVMGAFYWDQNDDVATNENPYGFTLQGGVFVSDDMELVARYEYGDQDTTATTNDWSTMTLGANWYLAKNTAKAGFNFGYAFDSIGAWAGAAAGNNWLADNAGEDGQWLIQAQMSFSF
ncbi:MAG: porin [Limnohabitans sp.]|nr:porin [Limnohabitans sp.]